MSSHHIVRDEQEPALVIASLTDFPLDKLGHLLEWAPVVVCFEPALDQMLRFGYKVDMACVANTENWLEKLEEQAPVKILETGNDLATVTLLLSKEGHREINVIIQDSELETYLDHISSLNALIHINVVTSSRRYSFISNGEYVKWLPGNTPIQLFPIENTEISIDGNLTHLTKLFEFQTVADGVLKLGAGKPFIIGT
jgi:thiamine pyrophosphokinase